MINGGGLVGVKKCTANRFNLILRYDKAKKTNRYSITMIERVNNYNVNNYNVNTISHENCLPVSICKNVTHKITKTTPHVY